MVGPDLGNGKGGASNPPTSKNGPGSNGTGAGASIGGSDEPKYSMGDKIVYKDYRGRRIAATILEVQDRGVKMLVPGETTFVWTSFANIEPFKDIPGGLKEPPSIDDWNGNYRKGDIVVGQGPDGSPVTIIITTSRDKTFYKGVDENGNSVAVPKVGTVPYSKNMSVKEPDFVKLRKQFDDYVQNNPPTKPTIAAGSIKLGKRQGDEEALKAKKGTSHTPSDDVVLEVMKGNKRYQINSKNINDEVGLSKIMNKFNHVSLRLGSAKAIKLDKCHNFTTKTAAKKFYNQLGTGAAGVNIKWGTSRQEIGIAKDQADKIREIVKMAEEGKEYGSIREKQWAYANLGTLVHESIHCWHPPGFGAKGEDTKINEGFTEWLAIRKTRTFIKATGLEKPFGAYIDNADIGDRCWAYKNYVAVVDKLNLMLENKGYNGEEILTRVHMHGYGFKKNWSLIGKALGKTGPQVKAAVEAAIKNNKPMEVVQKLR